MGLKIDTVIPLFLLILALLLTGCETYFEKHLVTSSYPEKTTPASDTEKPARTAKMASPTASASAKPNTVSIPISPYDKPGFVTEEEDGRLWVIPVGQKKSEKHVTFIGVGPAGKTIKAPTKDAALTYLAGKPGYQIEIEDGRIWVLPEGQKKSEKHISLIGAGLMGRTLKAPSRKIAIEYLAKKEGFQVELDDNNRIWVLGPGQEKSEKHISLIGAGPLGRTLKAQDRKTLIKYLGTKPGFEAELSENDRVWIYLKGDKNDKPEKHISAIGAGPLGKTIKVKDRSTLNAYLRTSS